MSGLAELYDFSGDKPNSDYDLVNKCDFKGDGALPASGSGSKSPFLQMIFLHKYLTYFYFCRHLFSLVG